MHFEDFAITLRFWNFSDIYDTAGQFKDCLFSSVGDEPKRLITDPTTGIVQRD